MPQTTNISSEFTHSEYLYMITTVFRERSDELLTFRNGRHLFEAVRFYLIEMFHAGNRTREDEVRFNFFLEQDLIRGERDGFAEYIRYLNSGAGSIPPIQHQTIVDGAGDEMYFRNAIHAVAAGLGESAGNVVYSQGVGVQGEVRRVAEEGHGEYDFSALLGVSSITNKDFAILLSKIGCDSFRSFLEKEVNPESPDLGEMRKRMLKKFQEMNMLTLDHLETGLPGIKSWYDCFFSEKIDDLRQKLEGFKWERENIKRAKKEYKTGNNVVKRSIERVFDLRDGFKKISGINKRMAAIVSEINVLEKKANEFKNFIISVRNMPNVKAIGRFPGDPCGLYILLGGLKIDNKDIGRFLFRISCKFSSFYGQMYAIRAVNLDKKYHQFEHFCIKPYKVCFGSFSSDISDMFLSGDIIGMIGLLPIYLTTKATKNPFCQWKEWIKKIKDVKVTLIFFEKSQLMGVALNDYLAVLIDELRLAGTYQRYKERNEGRESSSTSPSTSTSASPSASPSVMNAVRNDPMAYYRGFRPRNMNESYQWQVTQTYTTDQDSALATSTLY